jgi:hypothetical protein
MICHLIQFNLKPDLDAADRDWIFDQVQGLAQIPVVKRFVFGKLLDPKQEWYKPRMSADFGWVVSIDFDDEDGLYTYQKDPYHVSVAQEIRKRVTMIKVSDFVVFHKAS